MAHNQKYPVLRNMRFITVLKRAYNYTLFCDVLIKFPQPTIQPTVILSFYL